MAVNDEFGIGDKELQEIVGTKPKTNGRKKIVSDVKLTAKNPAAKSSQPLVKIMIDDVKGMSNYETVAPNGKVYKIRRGVPVEVPQEVVNALELCTMTHIEERKNPYTGEREEVKKHFSSIPWRRL